MSERRAPGPVLMLGTVQLGMNYEIANRVGRPTDEQARELFRAALDGGIEHLDTARAYGDAEERNQSALAQEQAQRLFIVSSSLR